MRPISARRRARCHGPPFFGPVIRSIISQTNNGRSFLSLILAKLLFLDIRCENIFALSIVTALTACSFSIKKCVKMSVFYVKTCWRLGATLPHPLGLRRLEVKPADPRLWPPSLPNPGCATDGASTKLGPQGTPPLKSSSTVSN